MADENSQNPQDSDATQADSAADIDIRLKALEEELAAAQKDRLYLAADFDNYKKRALKERSDYLKYAAERPFVELLDVLDNFERALQTEIKPENFQSFKQGVELTAKDLRGVLQKFGVSEIPSEGAPFDPTIHEAIASEDSEDVKPGHITKVFKKPYKLHDKVIRPGQVVIAKEKN